MATHRFTREQAEFLATSIVKDMPQGVKLSFPEWDEVRYYLAEKLQE